MKSRMIIPVLSAFAAGFVTMFAGSAIYAQGDEKFCESGKCLSDFTGYFRSSDWGRYTVVAKKASRGTSIPLDMKRFEYLCADLDGCHVRVGMHAWDVSQNVASRDFLLFFNKDNGVWRGSIDNPDVPDFSKPYPHDPFGSDDDGISTPINQSWSCILTDGEFVNHQDQGDKGKGISLLSSNWGGYNANCWATFID